MTSEELQMKFMHDREAYRKKEAEQSEMTAKIISKRVGIRTAEPKRRNLQNANVKKAPFNLAALGA